MYMDMKIKEEFLDRWEKYFGKAELPIIFYYGDDRGAAEKMKKSERWSCLVCELARVRKGASLSYGAEALGCGGAKRYLGYSAEAMPNFDYFLSCGIPGELEGERYIRTPEMVREIRKSQERLPVEGKNIVFKRWDKLVETDEPDAVIFFATPDVLSGLFTLANFDQTEPNGTFTPFGAGCGSIIYYPYLEKDSARPRAVIGMFDPSARPCVPANVLTFSVPMSRFVRMIGHMDESFLITDTWKKVRKRIGGD